MTDLARALAALEAAKKEVLAAQHALEELLSEIVSAPRAEKTAVSRAIQSALERLRSAHGSVEDAETVIAKDKEPP